MHSLIHLCDDVEHFKCNITNLTAFPFESELGKIKKQLRSGHKPLEQLCRRMAKESLCHVQVEIPPMLTVIKTRVENSVTVITKIKFKGYELSVSKPNNVVLLKDKNILKIKRICLLNLKTNIYAIEGLLLDKIGPASSFPEGAFTRDE